LKEEIKMASVLSADELLGALSSEIRGIRSKGAIGRAKATAAVSDAMMKVVVTDVIVANAKGRKPLLNFFEAPKPTKPAPVLVEVPSSSQEVTFTGTIKKKRQRKAA
jgi:hypothetical protein